MNAPAKINLYLHIVGRRDDGYHLLESIFVFMQWGDEVIVKASNTISLTITGPASTPLKYFSPEQNICYRAAKLLQQKYNVSAGAHIHVVKNIPVSAGLGGGSSDAATTLKLLNQFWELQLSIETLCALGATLGADVPACIHATPAFVSGVGEKITPITLSEKNIFVLLVNPNHALSTQKIFQHYRDDHAAFTESRTHQTNLDWIATQRNDLEKYAMLSLPMLSELLDAIARQSGCVFSRMSGSGATCFGIFNQLSLLKDAEKNMRKKFPSYWVLATKI